MCRSDSLAARGGSRTAQESRSDWASEDGLDEVVADYSSIGGQRETAKGGDGMDCVLGSNSDSERTTVYEDVAGHGIGKV